MEVLIIEGVNLANPRLTAALVARFGAVYTPQRTLRMSFSSE